MTWRPARKSAMLGTDSATAGTVEQLEVTVYTALSFTAMEPATGLGSGPEAACTVPASHSTPLSLPTQVDALYHDGIKCMCGTEVDR